MELNNFIVDVLKYSSLTKDQASSVKSRIMQHYHQFTDERKFLITEFLSNQKNINTAIDEVLRMARSTKTSRVKEAVDELTILILEQARMVIDKVRKQRQQLASRKVIPVKKATA